MQRRQFLKATCVGLATTPLSGCFFMGLLRVGVGRGAVGMLSRAARTRGAFGAATYGRGLSTTARAARANVTDIPRTEIYAPNGNLISRTIPDATGQTVRVRGSDLFYTRRGKKTDTHYSRKDVSGYSHRYDENVVEHRDAKRRTFGFDEYIEAARIIRHYDRANKIVGETQLSDDGETYHIETSEEFDVYMSLVDPDNITLCPAAQAEYDRFIELRKACVMGDAEACHEQRWSDSRFRNLLDNCKSDPV